MAELALSSAEMESKLRSPFTDLSLHPSLSEAHHLFPMYFEQAASAAPIRRGPAVCNWELAEHTATSALNLNSLLGSTLTTSEFKIASAAQLQDGRY